NGASSRTFTVTFSATDNAGNQAGPLPGGTVVQPPVSCADTIPPTSTAVASPGPNANGWNSTAVTVNLSAVDEAGGSGVKQISYSLSGAQTGGPVVAGSSAAVT